MGQKEKCEVYFIMKKGLKKILAVALVAAMSMSFTACSEEDSKDKVYNIGICQLVEHPALDAATKGFKDVLIEKLGEDKVKFDEQNAQGESATCATIVNSFVSSNVDLIMANATPALQSAANATGDIPVLGTSVTDYATALALKDFNGVVGGNVSGTSDLAPLDKQAQMVKELFPDAKNIGILYCSAEPNSKYQSTEITKVLEDLGYTCAEYTFVDSNDIAGVVQQAVAKSDVIYVPTDNTVASNTSVIDSIARPAGIPIVAGEEGICSGCGVATLSISYEDLGRATGEMAYEILVNGKDISEMQVEYADATTKKYNKEIADELKITIPEGYVAIGE